MDLAGKPRENPNVYCGRGMQRTEALKFLIFLSKKVKKVLDIPFLFCYSTQARLRGTAGGAKRTLKTIQKKERAIQEEDSEDSKEFSTERC